MTTFRKLGHLAAAAGVAAGALMAPAAHAAFINFQEQTTGSVLVTHDNNDWQSFSYTASQNTASVTATLFKFSYQGGNGNGTEVIFLKDAGGNITNLLTATVSVLNSSQYQVQYNFYTDAALPAVIPHSTGSYTDVVLTGNWGSVGLQSFSHAIGVGTAAVPEPQSHALMVLGLGALGVAVRRRQRR